MASRSSNVSARTGSVPARWAVGSVPARWAVGRAFRIEDAMLALRWAELVRPRGYRLSFSCSFAEADEAIQIHRMPQRRPIVTIFLGVSWVWTIDRTGRATPFDDLAAALATLVDLPEAERQALEAPRIPAWLPQFGLAAPPPASNGPARSSWLARSWRWWRQCWRGRPTH